MGPWFARRSKVGLLFDRVSHVGPWFARRSKVGLLFDKGLTRGSMVCEKVQSGSLV